MKVRLFSHLALPWRTSPEGVGALRGGAATVKHVRRSKGPFGCPLVIFSAASGPPGPNRVNGAVAPGVVGTRVPALARVVLPLRAGVAGRLVAVAGDGWRNAAWLAAGPPIGA